MDRSGSALVKSDLLDTSRIWVDNRWLIGKYNSGQNTFYSGKDDNSEVADLVDSSYSMQQLVRPDNYEWVKYSGLIPDGAVIGGTTETGVPLYVAMAHCIGPGGQDQGNATAYFSANNNCATFHCWGPKCVTTFYLMNLLV